MLVSRGSKLRGGHSRGFIGVPLTRLFLLAPRPTLDALLLPPRSVPNGPLLTPLLTPELTSELTAELTRLSFELVPD